MSRYMMTLRPLDTFFFGQENKYRKRKEEKSNELKVVADYFQESAFFPQQTTLLGMLRYYLLQVNGQLPIRDRTEAAKLIGEKSFRLSENGNSGELDFGNIRSLSPVFLSHKGQYYWPQPLDMHLNEDEQVEYFQKKEKTILKTNLPNHNGSLAFFPDYDEKEETAQFLIRTDNYKQHRPYKYDKKEKRSERGLFVPEERTGITKGVNGQTLEAAFYKQVVYRLKDDAAFQCIVELDDPKIGHGHEGFVPMGAEKSMFRIRFEETDKSLEDMVDVDNGHAPCLILLSDAYLASGSDQHYHFSISRTKPFRFLKTETKAGKWLDNLHFKDKKNGETTRSKRFNLFERGSVFYFKKENENMLDKMVSQLKGEKNFYQIGYNHFKTIR